MKLEKAPAWLVTLFDALIEGAGGTRKLMFGHPSLFENGHLCAGLFADTMMVRLAEADRKKLLALKGAKPFAPMPGRPMKEYVVLPPSMLEDEEAVQAWLAKALAYARTLPPKTPKKKR